MVVQMNTYFEGTVPVDPTPPSRNVLPGDTVLYTLESGRNAGEQRPALVTKVFGGAPLNTCNLVVFHDQNDEAVKLKRQDGLIVPLLISHRTSVIEGHGIGQWVFR